MVLLGFSFTMFALRRLQCHGKDVLLFFMRIKNVTFGRATKDLVCCVRISFLETR